METRQTAEAFSSHRFPEVYDRLADDVRWVLPGQATIQGEDRGPGTATTDRTALAVLTRHVG